jgi:hypothetical protein
VTLPKSDFWQKVATEHRTLRDHFSARPINNPDAAPQPGGVDPSVREQVISDLNGIADKCAGPEKK